MDNQDLADLIARARSGDELAVRTIVGRFEGDVRTMVRSRLPRALRSQFDSLDFVQSVWESFFTGSGREKVQFESPDHLCGYLSGVVRHKVFEEHRRRTLTKKYDLRRQEPLYIRRGNQEVLREVPARDPSPSQDVQASERLAQMLDGCTSEEAEVILLRRRNLTFDEIAGRTGISERSVRRIINAVWERLEARK